MLELPALATPDSYSYALRFRPDARSLPFLAQPPLFQHWSTVDYRVIPSTSKGSYLQKKGGKRNLSRSQKVKKQWCFMKAHIRLKKPSLKLWNFADPNDPSALAAKSQKCLRKLCAVRHQNCSNKYSSVVV